MVMDLNGLCDCWNVFNFVVVGFYRFDCFIYLRFYVYGLRDYIFDEIL